MVLLAIAAGWFLGAGLTAFAAAPWWTGGLTAAAATPWAVARWGHRGWVLAAVAAMLALAGGWRLATAHDQPPPALLAYRGARITFEGVVEGEPSYGATTRRYTVRAERLLAPENRPIDGRVLTVVTQYTELAPGERVRLAGVLQQPRSSPEFDYAAYLLQRGIVGELYRPRLERLGERVGAGWQRAPSEARATIEWALGQALPEPEASLAAGILVGRDEGMGPELRERFRRSGLAHLVAVSGSNVALVTAAAFALLVPLVGRRWAAAPAAFAALAYAAAAGGDPPVVRATIMAGIFLAGLAIGRPQAGLPALGLAAVAMTAADPRLLDDVGFQLSCAATAGLIAWFPWADTILARMLTAARLAWAVPRPLRSVAALTLCATLATAPISWATFGTLSLVGPAANVVAEPLFVPAFVCSAAAAAAAILWEPLERPAGLLAYVPLRAIVWTAETLGGEPWAAVDLPSPNHLAMLAMTALLLALGWLAARRRPLPAEGPVVGPHGRWARRVLVGALAGGAGAFAALTLTAQIPGPGVLQVAFLDVGQGDAILVTTPNGHDVLVDCGPSGLVLLREIGEVLPPWDRTIDRLLVSHPQADHVGGCAALAERYRIRSGTGWNGEASTGEAWSALAREVPNSEVLVAGTEWQVDGVTFRVVWPPAGVEFDEPNDASLVVEIVYGDVRILLTGDIEAAAQEAIAGAVGPINVLKVPHHGSATSRPGFFAAMAAEAAVISVGAGNPYGHPAPATLRALARAGSAIFRTDEQGRITMLSDGKRVWFETER